MQRGIILNDSAGNNRLDKRLFTVDRPVTKAFQRKQDLLEYGLRSSNNSGLDVEKYSVYLTSSLI